MSIDERLDAITMNLELLSERSVEMEERAEHAEERAERAEERHNHEMSAIRAELRRGIRLSIQEARAEHARRQKLEEAFDKKITQLAAAQLITEEKLQRLLDYRGNGKS